MKSKWLLLLFLVGMVFGIAETIVIQQVYFTESSNKSVSPGSKSSQQPKTASSNEMIVQGSVDRVIDGDTIVAHLTVLPDMELHGIHIRLEGINAPEMNTGAGKVAKQFLENALPPRSEIMFKTTKRDKYGRALGYIFSKAGENINQLMVSTGNAVPYFP